MDWEVLREDCLRLTAKEMAQRPDRGRLIRSLRREPAILVATEEDSDAAASFIYAFVV